MQFWYLSVLHFVVNLYICRVYIYICIYNESVYVCVWVPCSVCLYLLFVVNLCILCFMQIFIYQAGILIKTLMVDMGLACNAFHVDHPACCAV